MSLRLPLFIGLRYVRARSRSQLVSFISAASMAGIALGVAVLVTVLSVINGFEEQLRTRVLGVAPHVLVSNLLGPMAETRELRAQLAGFPGVEAVAPFVHVQSIISHADAQGFALVQGIDPAQEAAVSALAAHLAPGVFERLGTERFGILLGDQLARRLKAEPGDAVFVLAPQEVGYRSGSVPRTRRFQVLGTFKIGAEMDANLAIVHRRDATALAGMQPGEISGLRLKLADLFDAPYVAARLRDELDAVYYTSDWTRSLGPLYQAIQNAKSQIGLLLILIILVAAFNIVSMLVMAVNDKRADIAILRTQGASPGTIMAVFMVQGALSGVVGTAFGVLGGVGLSLSASGLFRGVESLLGLQLLDPAIYHGIDFLPSQLVIGDVLRVAGTALGLTLLATIYPAWQAARVPPAEALRYE